MKRVIFAEYGAGQMSDGVSRLILIVLCHLFTCEQQKTPCSILNEKSELEGEKIYLQIVDKVNEGPSPFICKATVQGHVSQ